MLYYLDELITATNATQRRRWFNIASALLVVVLIGALARAGVSSWVIGAALCVDLVVHVIFVVHWARKDALAAYKQSEREP
ncbi:hypothetical protein ACFC25_18590 [Pseudarthrobacter sp. NPDC055928]|uniref:hypothetical protein n=1 Tax=unclassified Pseudarthrobacter TaxID=2647000 RepID=UPI003076A2FF